MFTSTNKRFQLVYSLKIDGRCDPIKRHLIPKPGYSEESRPLGIPTIRDRAKQALVLLALEPEWEAKFEKNSYGFRPGEVLMMRLKLFIHRLIRVLSMSWMGIFENVLIRLITMLFWLN